MRERRGLLRSGEHATITLAAGLWLLVCSLSPDPAFGFSVEPSSSITHTRQQRSSTVILNQNFYNDFEDFEIKDESDDDDDDSDDVIDPDSLGDWRLFRRNLAVASSSSSSSEGDEELKVTSTAEPPKSVSKLNEEVLRSQNEGLYKEYIGGLWAHTTSTPEVGGLVVRLPLEAELFRNQRHSITGARLRKKLSGTESPTAWYRKAQTLVEREMMEIADIGGDDGQIDASTLSDEKAEMLSFYLDYQESWQEICLVLERDETKGTATTLVLNRPMAMKLTENLARICWYGIGNDSDHDGKRSRIDETKAVLVKFMLAFGQECAMYVGGPDDQELPAEIVHGIPNLPGAVEISPGSKIYRGGRDAAVDGVLTGLYKPLDFRFFIGRHTYKDSMLDVSVLLGKHQPVACSRSLVLKQCISLPKPLWHEVMEVCGGEMKELSKLELDKKDGFQYEIVDDDEEEYDGDDEDGLVLFGDDLSDELDELFYDEDDDDDK